MNYRDKSKEELISIIEEIQKSNDSLEQASKSTEVDGAIYESKKMLELVMDSIPQFIFWKDVNSVYLGCNDNFAKVAGLKSAKEIIGKTDYDLAWEKEEADFFVEVDRRVMKSGKAEFHIIEPQLQADGKKAWLETNKVPMFNNSGEVIGILGTYEDITERKNAEMLLKEKNEKIESQNQELIKINKDLNLTNEELQIERLKNEENEKQLQLIANNLVNGMIYQVATLDENKRKFNYVSDAVNNLYGCTPEEAKQNADLIYGKVHPDDINSLIEKEKEALKTMSIFKAEARVINPDGSTRWAYYISQPRMINGIVCWDGIEVDISDRKKMEFELTKAKELAEESEKKFSKLFHISPEPQTVTSLKDGRIIMINDAFSKSTGFNEKEVIGRTSLDLNVWIKPEDRQKWVDELSATGQVSGLEIPFRTKSFGIRDYLVSSDIIELEGEKCSINLYLDITKRKQMEEELTKSKERAEESDKLKTAFLQNMSHEIRTPMNAIMGFSHLMVENYDDKPKLEHFSSIINQRCGDLLEIINDILDISKIESGQLAINIEECNIKELFIELNSFYKEYQKRIKKEHIDFRLISQCDSPLVIRTDKVKLKQILINLITNAFKFTEEGSISCSCKIENEKLIFNVSDTGIGIPKDKFEIIFNRFSQLHNSKKMINSGTGLGLSIAKGLTGLLGGEIWLESELDDAKAGTQGGTTFCFSITYNKSNTAKNEPAKITKKGSVNFEDKTILIVEDDYYNAEYLKEVLSKTGINILQTKYGKEATEIVTKRFVDLVLMDVRLPDINGYEATQIIKKYKPELNIIAQTAYAAQDERQKALETGCVDYISKPTNKGQLLELISKYLTDKK